MRGAARGGVQDPRGTVQAGGGTRLAWVKWVQWFERSVRADIAGVVAGVAGQGGWLG